MRRQLTLVALALLGGMTAPAPAQPLSTFFEEQYHGRYHSLAGGATVIWDGAVGTYDDNQVQVPIGFPFLFDGVTYTTVDVCVNGYVTFDSGAPYGEFSNDPIPDASTPTPVIAAWWDDLEVADNGATDMVWYNLIGRPGQRRFVVEWSSVSRHLDTAAVYSYANFQIHLVEGTNQIELRYGTHGEAPGASDYSATVGVENRAATFGHDPIGGSPGLTRADFPAWEWVILYRPAYPTWTYTMTSTPAPTAPLHSPVVIWDGSTGIYDDQSERVEIGFPFVYDGVNFLDVHVCVNGFVTFGPGGPSGDFTNDPIPSPGPPNPVLAPWWDDLCVYDHGTTDRVQYELAGTPGNRHLAIEWYSISRQGDTAATHSFAYFQLWLNEADNSITFWYAVTARVGTPTDYSASAGIEGNDGLVGIEALGGSPSLAFADFPQGTRYDFRSVVCGDCNGDGSATITDALQAAQHAVSILTLSGSNFVACNVSGIHGPPSVPGAAVDILDALAIAQFAVGSVPILTC